MNLPAILEVAAKRHPYPLLFATVSGAHLYGFPSPDSDYDLRGAHILPVTEVVGFDEVDDTIESATVEDGIELDLVTHDIKKFFTLMLKNNGYVLEQLYSPLVVHTTEEHQELKKIGTNCITRHHVHHYLGFADNQWKLFTKEHPSRVKPLLYVYRVLLTGIHLMRTGRIESNLVVLNEEFKLSHITELIELKLSSKEKHTLKNSDLEFHHAEYERLRMYLDSVAHSSKLSAETNARPALNSLLKQLRLNSFKVPETPVSQD